MDILNKINKYLNESIKTKNKKVNFKTKTDGNGLYTEKKATVKITKLSFLLYTYSDYDSKSARIEATFDSKDWNVKEDSIIYTDPLWLKTFKKEFSKEFKIPFKMVDDRNPGYGIHYSEAGAQGETYVDLDLGVEIYNMIFKK